MSYRTKTNADRADQTQLCVLIPTPLNEKLEQTARRLLLSKSDVTRLVLMGELSTTQLDYLDELHTARQDRLFKINDPRTSPVEKAEYTEDVADIDQVLAQVLTPTDGGAKI